MTKRGVWLIWLFLLLAAPAVAQVPTARGEWWSWGGDVRNTRYSPLDQIDAENFEQLELAWLWRGDNFGPGVVSSFRSTPTYGGGRLYTVAGSRRTVVAIDPATGETLWTFREPPTSRWERSPRQASGRGVTYHEIGGRGIVYVVTPGFFLHALDAETGRPLEGFGGALPIEGFPSTGSVDLLADLGYPYDPEYGTPDSVGYISNSAPPVVVNDVLVVGSSGHNGMGGQTRLENVAGNVLAYDARTGEHRWRFDVIPGPGELGHETWENDAWSYTGNINAWAPLSADPELGIVYVPTDAPTNDVYGGFRPGDNLFGNSVLALDVRTGERVWHFQTVHHDIWDRDNPVPPVLLDVTVDGREVSVVTQATKHGLLFTFDRATGEPLWPIEEVAVPASTVPGERSSATQPIPTKPAPFEIQGFSEDDLVDFTPELRARALEATSRIRFGPLFNPPIPRDNPEGDTHAVFCPGVEGGANIPGGPVADPETGILYVPSVKSCTTAVLIPGSEYDDGSSGRRGQTVAAWVRGPGGSLPTIEGIPVYAPPYGRITAIDMNTGEHLWWIPTGGTSEAIANHPLLRGVELPTTGRFSHATALVTATLLVYGEGTGGDPLLHAVDKRTGEPLGTASLPARSNAAPMTFLHEGVQYLVVPVGDADVPGSLAALRIGR